MSTMIGRSLTGCNAALKSCGKTLYIPDIVIPSMIFGGILRSPYAHARVKSINTAKARALPGVRAIVTFDDGINKKYNCAGTPPSAMVIKDEMIISDKMRFCGDKVAAVAADTKEILNRALKLIEVEYEVLSNVFEIEEAIAPGAPIVHEEYLDNVAKVVVQESGNIDQGFSNAEKIFEGIYTTHMVQAAPLDMTGCICHFTVDNSLSVWSNTQTPHQDKRILAELFDIPESRVRCRQPFIGGAFGSRQQMHQQPICALLSKISGFPVKMINTREEEFLGAVRHPAMLKIKTGVSLDGTIVAMHITIYLNTGAYSTHGPIVLAAIKSRMPYKIPNYKFEGYCVYSNLPPAGALRGYGNPQLTFARETHLDEIAISLGLDPVEFRLKNHVKTNEKIPGLSWKVESCGIEECVEAANRTKNLLLKDLNEPKGATGWGVSFCLHGSGISDRDMSSAIVLINDDGSINLLTGAVDIGQGSDVALAQVAAEELGILDLDLINVFSSDTTYTPYDTGAFSSRQMYVSGKAVQEAACDAKQQLLKRASRIINCSPDRLTIKNGFLVDVYTSQNHMSFSDLVKKISFGDYSQIVMGKSIFKPVSSPPPVAVCWAQVKVDTNTGKVQVPMVIISVDVGKAINPQIVKGQIEGGVLMGVGYALHEEICFESNSGYPLSLGFMRYGFPTIKETVDVVVNIIESNEPTGPFGAKSVGEIPTIPVAAAISNAFFQATGVRIRKLPLTPDNVLFHLRNAKG